MKVKYKKKTGWQTLKCCFAVCRRRRSSSITCTKFRLLRQRRIWMRKIQFVRGGKNQLWTSNFSQFNLLSLQSFVNTTKLNSYFVFFLSFSYFFVNVLLLISSLKIHDDLKWIRNIRNKYMYTTIYIYTLVCALMSKNAFWFGSCCVYVCVPCSS